jgi:hypothetical protein
MLSYTRAGDKTEDPSWQRWQCGTDAATNIALKALAIPEARLLIELSE